MSNADIYVANDYICKNLDVGIMRIFAEKYMICVVFAT